MIRTHLVKALYEKMLGPESGVNEIAEFPFTKYVTGIISTTFAPESKKEDGEQKVFEDPGARNDPIFTTDKVFATSKLDESSVSEEIGETFHETALDPRSGSKSMGVSFVILSSQTPKISVCCTWARYELQDGYDRYEHGLFQRFPNFYIKNEIIIDGEDKRIPLPVGSTPTQNVTRSGVILHIRQRKSLYEENKWTISVYLENSTKFDLEIDEREREEHRIFQPQIRINCLDDTQTESFEYTVTPEKNSLEAKDMLGFRNRTSKARGHQCGSVWKEVDPEQESEGFGKFTWVDSTQENFPETAKENFTCPDIRTDYFPSYTILQPDLSEKPEFEAEQLAEMWNPDDIRNDTKNGLQKISISYKEWIKQQYDNLEKLNLENNLYDTAKTNLALCDESLGRIEKGIELICTDTRARLAFCFMNKVMATKMRWDKSDDDSFTGLKWREFQMAFILQSLTGLTGIDKDDAAKCDVLWFPTGGGKTEAYLGLSMFVLAFRRLTHDQEFENDGGVTILSRYTLRLLTIQQFTRSTGSILAADLLRIQNWKPKQITSFDDVFLDENYNEGILWGHSRISIGLWIGGGISPNKFSIYKRWNGPWIPHAEGALAPHRLQNPDRINDSSGEPAQIAICPCCKNILATTSMKNEESKTLIWLIKTSKSKEELLNNITDEDLSSDNYQVKVENLSFSIPEFTSTSNDDYKLLKAKITVFGKDVDKKINRWWDYIVEDKIASSDSRALVSTSASRPGYFFLTYSAEIYDYSIHCTNPECILNTPGTKWFEDKVQNSIASVAEPFLDPEDLHHSSSVPISAFTVDTQVYAKCPTFILATADKFARLPFDHRSSSIFGNVDTFHNIFAYGRDQNGTVTRKQIFRTPLDTDKDQKNLDSKDFTAVKPFNPPNLIIQDELHLIEGPLGSMVGIYEMAVDILGSNKNQQPKYIASSATIKEAESQVAAIYRRDINIFPQPGLESNDTYFSQLEEDISSVQSKPGRLYLGICAGVGTYIIPVKIWAVLLSEVFRIRNNATNPEYGLVEDFENQLSQSRPIENFQDFVDKKIDLYWTLVGFFSDLELLARTTNFYNQDIYRDVKQFSVDILENISKRGIGTGKKKSIKFYPFTVPRNFNASYLSVLCQGDGGNISIAIYDDKDGKPNQIIKQSKDDDERIKACSKDENIFDLDGNLQLQENQKIWFSVMLDSDDCFFQTGTEKIKCYESSSFEQIEKDGEQVDDLGNFSNATSNLKESEELPVRIFLKSEHRELDANKRIEMSSRTDSTELPGILDKLGITENNQVDALLTSPIFGTGIDITRLGMMVVMNQPKTTSQYIQATGRVGRNDPGLVVAWLRMGRHRDLNHYESFIGYHRAIHRYVEPITASPFSEKTMEQYLGPVIVAALRVAKQLGEKTVPTEWVPTNNGSFIIGNDQNEEIATLHKLMENIACWKQIPKIRRLDKDRFYVYYNEAINKWNKAAKYAKKDNSVLAYYDYSYMHSKKVKKDVVLGSPRHKIEKKHIAYEDTKTSLREIESTTGIGETLV